MDMISQLQQPIPLQTPKGKAWAVAIIDYGPHWDLLWITFLHDSGECWTFNNSEIRQEKNYTFGLTSQSPIKTATSHNDFQTNGSPESYHKPEPLHPLTNGAYKQTN